MGSRIIGRGFVRVTVDLFAFFLDRHCSQFIILIVLGLEPAPKKITDHIAQTPSLAHKRETMQMITTSQILRTFFLFSRAPRIKQRNPAPRIILEALNQPHVPAVYYSTF